MTNTPNLVHEADAQRHHVRVKLPAKIEINGTAYDLKDWSTGGARVSAPEQAGSSIFAEGKVHSARLIFDMAGFAITVPMTVEARHVEQEDDGSYIGLRFVDMNKEQIVIMQHLVNSYVTGTLTSVDEMIHVVSRNNFTKARQIPKREDEMSFGEKFSHGLKKMAVPLVSILLIGYVAIAVFEQKFVVSAQNAVVTGDAITVPAPAGGVISFKDLHNGDKVKKGDVLMTVLSDAGTVTGIDSPCDCVIDDRPVEAGTTVSKGSVLIKLLPVNTPLRVEARVSYEDAVRLVKGQTAVIHLPGAGKEYKGSITGVTIGAQAGATAKVIIRPVESIPVDMVGIPVSVKINTIAGSSGK